MKFSIITATFNSEKTLTRAIESVMTQGYNNSEHILIDGGSKDGTVGIIREFAEKYPGRIKWISEPDDGIYYALNKGFDLASGDIIGILGSDDWYVPGVFQKVADVFLKNRQVSVVYGLVNVFIDDIHIRTEGCHHNNLANTTLAHQSCFVLKMVHDKYGHYNTAYKIAADYDFLLKLSKHDDVVFHNMNIPLANYSGDGLSSNEDKRFFEFKKIQLKNGILSKKTYDRKILKRKIKIFLGNLFPF